MRGKCIPECPRGLWDGGYSWIYPGHHHEGDPLFMRKLASDACIGSVYGRRPER